MAGWVGTGIALQPPTSYPTPGTPLPATPYMPYVARWLHAEYKVVVGLISVAQLSLGTHISGFPGITEVYNLSRIGRIINH